MKLDFSQKYAVRPLTAGDVDKILALCAENEQFYRYHPPLATRSLPMWLGMLLLATVYFLYAIRKLQNTCETIWEVSPVWH